MPKSEWRMSIFKLERLLSETHLSTNITSVNSVGILILKWFSRISPKLITGARFQMLSIFRKEILKKKVIDTFVANVGKFGL